MRTDTQPVQAILYGRHPGSRDILLRGTDTATATFETELYDNTMIISTADAFEADVSYRSQDWASFWNEQIDNLNVISFIGPNGTLGRGMIARTSTVNIRASNKIPTTGLLSGTGIA